MKDPKVSWALGAAEGLGPAAVKHQAFPFKVRREYRKGETGMPGRPYTCHL